MPTIAFRVDEDFAKDLDWFVAELQKESGGMVTASRSSVIKAIVRERLDEERKARSRKRKK